MSNNSGSTDNNLRVLVAEDHPANQRLVLAILKPHGYEVTLVETGQEVLDQWRENEFDLILMDMQMPVMDGLDATIEIRAREIASGRPRTPIAMLTAHAMEDHLTQTMAAGADHHITKPVSPSNLIAGMEETLVRAMGNGSGSAKATSS